MAPLAAHEITNAVTDRICPASFDFEAAELNAVIEHHPLGSSGELPSEGRPRRDTPPPSDRGRRASSKRQNADKLTSEQDALAFRLTLCNSILQNPSVLGNPVQFQTISVEFDERLFSPFWQAFVSYHVSLRVWSITLPEGEPFSILGFHKKSLVN